MLAKVLNQIVPVVVPLGKWRYGFINLWHKPVNPQEKTQECANAHGDYGLPVFFSMALRGLATAFGFGSAVALSDGFFCLECPSLHRGMKRADLCTIR